MLAVLSETISFIGIVIVGYNACQLVLAHYMQLLLVILAMVIFADILRC